MSAWTYLVAVPVFGLLILVHEWGHYLASRAVGIPVAEFSVGFGPRLFGRRRRGTDWSLRAVPLGGYVRWFEDGYGAWADARIGARAIALAGGPLANLVLTYLCFVAFYFAVGKGWGAWGLAWDGLVWMLGEWGKAFLSLFQGAGLDALEGPVGIARTAAQSAAMGLEPFLLTTASLSLSLGLFNLLPFPMLDGGRLGFLALERIRRRPLDPYLEGWIHTGGFVLLIAVAFITVVKDLLA